MKEENIEEGTITLDPEMRAKEEEAKKAAEEKMERMRKVNSSVTEALKVLSDENDVKIMAIAYSNIDDEIGIWKSKNITTLDESGFSKILGNQF